MTLNITEVAAQVEAACVTLETEIAELRAQKAAINEQITTKSAELALAQSMRPRKRTVKPVTDAAPAAE